MCAKQSSQRKMEEKGKEYVKGRWNVANEEENTHVMSQHGHTQRRSHSYCEEGRAVVGYTHNETTQHGHTQRNVTHI